MVESKALVAEVADGASPRLVQKTVQLPDLASNQVLVKVSAVAQNPTDVQAFDTNAFGDGTVLGCDFAGTVEEVGSSVTRVSKGDIIAGLIWGGEVKGLGAYSEYTIADERICFKVPLDITLPEAATMLLAALTAYLALFSKDSLNIDATSESNTSLLIWGGSSSVGLYAIQIAELFRFKIVTTCSPHHFEHVQSRGVQHVFDYRDPEVVQKIKAAVPGIKYVFDTIGNDTSSVLGSQTIDEGGGTLCTVRPGKAFTEGVSKQTKVTDVLVWTAFLKEHRYREYYWPPNERDHQLATEFCESLPDLISRGTVLPNDVRILPGGLDAVETGFQEHRDGKISGTKLVYELERAPWSRR
ncbi:chaperonin 10-like protein [Thelonectria olida]|uniref:Chaperonin 10-like protein n=1 Tax=Thelonectria olida TaxID=1576542 RepID=A0A9P9APF4_9HYPO|nr:chaperonin 10-like protein [Thelonectria olida]